MQPLACTASHQSKQAAAEPSLIAAPARRRREADRRGARPLLLRAAQIETGRRKPRPQAPATAQMEAAMQPRRRRPRTHRLPQAPPTPMDPPPPPAIEPAPPPPPHRRKVQRRKGGSFSPATGREALCRTGAAAARPSHRLLRPSIRAEPWLRLCQLSFGLGRYMKRGSAPPVSVPHRDYQIRWTGRSPRASATGWRVAAARGQAELHRPDDVAAGRWESCSPPSAGSGATTARTTGADAASGGMPRAGGTAVRRNSSRRPPPLRAAAFRPAAAAKPA
ncbi:unnamed protein product [Urochloa humidicola]